MFIGSSEETINTAHILSFKVGECVVHRRIEKSRVKFNMLDGSVRELVLSDEEIRRLRASANEMLFNAGPGFSRVDVWRYRNGEIHSCEQPVIAWKSNGEGGLSAICLEGCLSADQSGIVYPDGMVLHVGWGETHDSVKAWLEYLKAEWIPDAA